MSIEYNVVTNTCGHIIDTPDGCIKNKAFTCFMAWHYAYTFPNVGGDGYLFDINLASFSAYRFGCQRITAATGKIFSASRPRAGDAYNNVLGTTVLNNNTWYHIAVMWDWAAAKVYLYLNGVLEYAPVAQAGWGSPTENNNALYECVGQLANGSGGSANNCIDGKVDDVRVYNRQVSANEILTIYNAAGSDRILNGCSHRLLMTGGAFNTNAAGAGVLKCDGEFKNTFTEKFPAFPASNIWKESYIKNSDYGGN
jgi:hypothetical protein